MLLSMLYTARTSSKAFVAGGRCVFTQNGKPNRQPKSTRSPIIYIRWKQIYNSCCTRTQVRRCKAATIQGCHNHSCSCNIIVESESETNTECWGDLMIGCPDSWITMKALFTFRFANSLHIGQVNNQCPVGITYVCSAAGTACRFNNYVWSTHCLRSPVRHPTEQRQMIYDTLWLQLLCALGYSSIGFLSFLSETIAAKAESPKTLTLRHHVTCLKNVFVLI